MKDVLIETNWEQVFLDYFAEVHPDQDDASHDLAHFRRVSETAKKIAEHEAGDIDPLVLLASAYFHDIVSLPKNHPDAKLSSRYAAVEARKILTQLDFPQEKIEAVAHAIEAHSFSAKITPESLEAKIIQDADRMESLGTLGIMRTFYVSGRLERPPYDPDDFYAERRLLDDRAFGLDHFYCKLFKLPSLLQTTGGRQIASTRANFLSFFVKELEGDVQKNEGGAHLVTWTCYHAGKAGLKLFDSLDPLAHHRQLNPQYVLDQLLGSSNKYPRFLQAFFTQFLEEITIGSRQETVDRRNVFS